MGVGRAHNIIPLLVVQDISQLRMLYIRAEADTGQKGGTGVGGWGDGEDHEGLRVESKNSLCGAWKNHSLSGGIELTMSRKNWLVSLILR